MDTIRVVRTSVASQDGLNLIDFARLSINFSLTDDLFTEWKGLDFSVGTSIVPSFFFL